MLKEKYKLPFMATQEDRDIEGLLFLYLLSISQHLSGLMI